MTLKDFPQVLRVFLSQRLVKNGINFDSIVVWLYKGSAHIKRFTRFYLDLISELVETGKFTRTISVRIDIE